MRTIIKKQPSLGTLSISELQLDAKSRDDIPRVLRSLQAIDADSELKSQIFTVLDRVLPDEINRETGRPGMPLWNVFVLGALKQAANIDFDRLQELANKHSDVRCMLMLGYFDTTHYPLQTLRDNVHKLTPDVLDEINQLFVKAGQQSHLQQNPKLSNTYLHGRCDSFVVETDVSFPTDLGLLRQCTTQLLHFGNKALEGNPFQLWRQTRHLKKSLNKHYHRARKASHSASKSADNPERFNRLQDCVIAYAEDVYSLCNKAEKTLLKAEQLGLLPEVVQRLDHWNKMTKYHMGLVARRILLHEKIPHNDKLFSLFQPHTEWVNKGKAGVPVELGLRVCVLQDQYGFTLHHHVMEQQTDSDVAVTMVEQAKVRFPNLKLVSFDKGFWSKENYNRLNPILESVIMPKKGKCNAQEAEREEDVMFKRAKRQHSAVESDINALESRGLNKCKDHGIEGFKRHVALSVVANNLCRWGKLLLEQDALSAKNEAKKQAGLQRAERKRAAASSG